MLEMYYDEVEAVMLAELSAVAFLQLRANLGSVAYHWRIQREARLRHEPSLALTSRRISFIWWHKTVQQT